MFKKMIRGTGRVLKPLVNVPVWMNWQGLKDNHQKLSQMAKELLVPEKGKVEPETFEQAVVRLQLTEPAIKARQQYLKRLAIAYALLAIVVFAYAMYLLVVVGTVLGFLTTLVMVWVALVLAFRQHFWYIQMRERRLGLTFRDWFQLAFQTKNKVKI